MAATAAAVAAGNSRCVCCGVVAVGSEFWFSQKSTNAAWSSASGWSFMNPRACSSVLQAWGAVPIQNPAFKKRCRLTLPTLLALPTLLLLLLLFARRGHITPVSLFGCTVLCLPPHRCSCCCVLHCLFCHRTTFFCCLTMAFFAWGSKRHCFVSHNRSAAKTTEEPIAM